MDEQYWIFTFGCGYNSGNRRNKYVKIPGDYDTARSRMFEWYGKKWSSQYSPSDFEPIRIKYNIEEYNENIIFDED